MLTETGELSSKELWLRVVIAAVAITAVLLVAHYVFVVQIEEMATQLLPPAAGR